MFEFTRITFAVLSNSHVSLLVCLYFLTSTGYLLLVVFLRLDIGFRIMGMYLSYPRRDPRSMPALHASVTLNHPRARHKRPLIVTHLGCTSLLRATTHRSGVR